MSIKSILVAVDFSPTSERGLVTAMDLARATGAVLTILHVNVLPHIVATELDPFGRVSADELRKAQADAQVRVRARLDELAAQAKGQGVTVETKLREGYASEVIVDESAHHDITVMGSHGRSAMERVLLGSVVQRVLRHTKGSVLVVR